MKNVLLGIVRWVFGLFYAGMGATSLTFRLLGKPFVTPVNNAQGHAFASALTASGFIDPLISITCLGAGCSCSSGAPRRSVWRSGHRW